MPDKYILTKYETETIINFNDDEAEATLYTCNKAWMRKMDKLCKKQPEMFKLKKQDGCSKTYSFPKKLVAVRTPVVMSEEQKEKARLSGERLQSILRQNSKENA